MIKTENLLASLSMEIPAIEENAEGQLRGGFGFFGPSDIDVLGNGNCGNCDCSSDDNCDICNGNCGNCSCRNASCTTPAK